MKPLILIIEDEDAQAQILQYNLEAENIRVLHAPKAEDGLLAVREDYPDLILLDWMLPDMAGIEVCRQIKSNTQTQSIPVIMLTARGAEDDKIRGLNVGADDYVVKPYSMKELIARIRANIRKSGQSDKELQYADISLNTETHRVKRGEDLVKLGPTEFKLLQVFLKRPQRVFSRTQLLDLVWGKDIYVDERTVDVHVGRLRKALNAKGKTNLIRTIRSAGYSLDVES
jgi:two-component system phosphate regulon response regulator PhoB